MAKGYQNYQGYQGYDPADAHEDLKRKRELAHLLMARAPASPQNLGEGLHSFGVQIGAALMQRRANKDETAAREKSDTGYNELIAAQLAGRGGAFDGARPAPVTDPAARRPGNLPPSPGNPGNLPLVGDQGPTKAAHDLALLGKTEGVQPDVLARLDKVQQRFGRQLPITSGYRDPEHNKRVGGAKKSQHLGGAALDIDVSSLPEQDRLRLMQIASEEGFTGLGVYDNSLHFDVGPRRAWGPSYGHESVPEWAQPVIGQHMAGEFAAPQGPVAHTDGAPQPQQGVQVAQAGGIEIDPALIQALGTAAGDPFLSPGKRAIAQALLQQELSRSEPMTPYQQAQLAQGDRQLAQDDDQFRATHGLNVAEYDQARREFMATHGLNERQFEESKGQFQADLAHRQAQLSETQRQHDNPQPTGDMQEYDAYAAQEQAAGRQPLGRLEYQLALKADGGTSAMQEKIGLLESTGLDRETATNIATGRFVVSRDPITQQAQIVDKATGQRVGDMPSDVPPWAITGDSAQPPTSPPPMNEQQPGASQAGNLYDRTGEGTGILSGAKELSSNTLGQLPGGVGDFFSFPATTETRQAFRAATGDLIRAFSVNPRFPVSEMERIREQLGVEPAIWSDPEAMQSRMVAIDSYLRNKLAGEQQAANDPALPADQRQASIATARAIEQYLGLLGVPQDAGQGEQQPGGVPRPSSEAEYRSLPSGTEYMAPDGKLRRKP